MTPNQRARLKREADIQRDNLFKKMKEFKMSVNKVMLFGKVCTLPSAETTQGGFTKTTFAMKTTETWKDKKSGQQNSKDDVHCIIIQNEDLIKYAFASLKVGSFIYVEGKIQGKEVEKNGKSYKFIDIVIPYFGGRLVCYDAALNAAQSGGLRKTTSNDYRQKSYDNQDYDRNNLNDDVPF